MDKKYRKVKIVAFDLDGTLTQHKEKLSEENKAVLDELSKKYKLLMAGAGQARRIFEQLNRYPIDIIGNYGLQYAEYDKNTGDIVLLRDESIRCDRKIVEERVTALRKKFGFTDFAGENVEFHPSGCVTFPILGTKAEQSKKLAFDPTRSKRRAIYEEVKNAFKDFNVFVGGSSSFDMSPAPYDKYYALDLYAKSHGLSHENIVYTGDDYGPGGNDESVFKSDFLTIKTDDYKELDKVVSVLLD